MIKRKFLPGEEWLYLKIYSGPNLIEEILNDYISPIVLNLLERKIITKFFFVRFYDESFHLRLRFHLASVDNISQVLVTVNRSLKGFVDSRMISKITIDTYARELERYGVDNISSLEDLFTYDSLQILTTTRSAHEPWLSGIKSMDYILERFEFDDLRKQEFYESYYQQYSLEFGGGKLMREQLSKKQRKYGKTIIEIMDQRFDISQLPEEIIELRDNSINKLKKNLNKSSDIQDFILKSFSHMHFNRIIKNKQRFHEYVIYNLMSNYYRSKIARNKK